MNKYYIYTVFFWCLLGFAQENQNNFVFDYISSKEGLSHNYVTKVVSDSLNVKWIATENGITKYDGVNYYTIRPGLKYPGLQNENIETLFLDSKNNLWIGTKSGGLSKLEIKTHKLTNLNNILTNATKASLRIKAIQEDNEGNIWVGTHQKGIYVLDPIEEKIVQHHEITEYRFIKKDKQGNIWFTQGFSLKKYVPEKRQIFSYSVGEYVSTMIDDTSRNCFWFGIINNKAKHHVLKLDKTTNKFTKVYTKIPAEFTSTLYLDRHDNLWVGTWGNGLYTSDSEVSKFKKMNLVYPPDAKKTNNYEIILDIHEDKNNVLWISSDFGGIVTLTEGRGFENLDQFVTNKTLVEEKNFHSVFQDEEDVYLGTLRNGLFYGKDFESLVQLKETSKSKVQAISKHNDDIVISTSKAVLFLNKNHNVTNTLKIGKATCFLSENNNTLWVGSQLSGLFKVKTGASDAPEKVKIFSSRNPKAKIESMRITSMVKDSQNNFWLGTYNGLHLYDKAADEFVHHSKLLTEEIPNIINTIYTDSEYVWLGTPSGLFKLQYAEGKLSVLKTYDALQYGLENDFICGITSDNQGFIWLTTSTNLIRFDKFNDSFVNFGEQDGVYTSVFNLRSLFNTSSKSVIYAGGTDNLTYFNPESIVESQKEEELIFTYLKIDNKKIEAFDTINEHIILTKDFNYTNAIKLSHKEKSFGVGFTNVDYLDNSAINYRYKLVGFDEQWNYLKNQNEINFIGLSAGAYELLISSSKDYKNWTVPIKLNVDILYAPWASPFAYALYFMIILGTVVGVVFVLMRQFQLKDKLEKERELSEAKFTFFTNISHEFRTPLTLIVSPIKEILQGEEKLSPHLTDKLVTIEKNSDRLFNLITQLLDFRKAEHGLLKLDVRNGNFVRFSNEVFLYFKEQARIKNIEYTFSCNKAEILFPFDRNKMEIVLCNLISNALKYTEENDKISLDIKANSEVCKISLKDTGIGMSKMFKKKIFDRFYQIQSTNTSNIIGSGIGLSFSKKIIELHHGSIDVESKVEHGTEFIIELPLGHNFYQQEVLNSKRQSTDLIENYQEIDNSAVIDLKVKSKENTLLIVDDNNDIRNYLNQLLRGEYNILEAKNGVEGVEVATQEVPDLILCDIMMPEKDGLAVCKDLKSQITTSHIPIILLTARSSNMFEIQGLEIGADDFITKPFDPQVIKARISSVLQNRAKIRESFLNKIRFEPSSSNIEQSDPEGVFIEQAVLLVEENLTNESFDIKTMIDKLNMSQSSLYRKIKSLTGLSITAFIRSVRLKKAAEYILTGDDKLSVVSQRVGFNDYKYFRESFKSQFSCLPSEYKMNKIENNN
ncbi:hybrid sensor histidine kinase/response regulator transcription factor [Algibacter mikhailovii]|nr:hybrid sensor histidine kinase/response regulator transcription factor [Algibacter mikhailovii]